MTKLNRIEEVKQESEARREIISKLTARCEELISEAKEARRQERERMMEIVVEELERQKIMVHTHPLHGGDYCQMCLFVKTIRQALKGESEQQTA